MHGQVAAVDRLHGHFGLRCISDAEFFKLVARQHGQPRLISYAAWIFEQCLDRPVFLIAEGFDFHLALDDDAQRHRLHAARRFCAGQFAPQHRREFETHQIIQRTPRKIGVDQRHVDLARVFHRLGHGGFGDGVEHDARHRGVFLDRFFRNQSLGQVPANRLAFTVGVGRQDKFIIVFERVNNRLDMLFAVACYLPFHVEIFVGQHRAILGRQVADVAIRGEHRVVGP